MDTKWKLVVLVVVAAAVYAYREPIANWWQSLRPASAAVEESAAPQPERTSARVAEMDAASEMSRDASRGGGAASTGAGAAASRASNALSGAGKRDLPQ